MSNAENELNATQTAWLNRNGVESWVAPACYGFKGGRVYAKGDYSVCSYSTGWDLEVIDYDWGLGRGAYCVGTYTTLKEALSALVRKGGNYGNA